MNAHMTQVPELDVLVTNRCNSRCIYCSQSAGESHAELSQSAISSVIASAIRMGIREVHFTGGEPFCRDDIRNIIEGTLSVSVKAKIATSGMGCTHKQLKQLKRMGMDWIGISIDSLSCRVTSRHRGHAKAYDAGMKTFLDAVDLGFSTEIMTVVLNDNIDEIAELSRWLAESGASQHTLFYPSPMGRGKTVLNDIPSVAKWLEMENRVRTCSFEEVNTRFCIKYETPVFDLNKPKTRALCRLLTRSHILIREDGEVFPCALLLRTGYSLGNIHERDLEEIWNYEPNWQMFSQLREEYACKDCESFKICFGGCLAYRILLGKNAGEAGPQCPKVTGLERLPMCIVHYERHYP